MQQFVFRFIPSLRATESFLHDDCFKDMIEKNHDFICFIKQVQLLKGHKKQFRTFEKEPLSLVPYFVSEV